MNVRGMYGIRIQPGEHWSSKYEGYLHQSDGRYRFPKVWKNSETGRLRHANRYYIEVQCSICGKDHLSDVTNHKENKRYACSRECQNQIIRVPDGTKRMDGYKSGAGRHVLVKASTHPNRNRMGCIPEHRLVVEQSIGRLLKRGEIIHHINLIKDDNRLENLVICKNHSEHFCAHSSLNICVAALMESGALGFDKEKLRYFVK